MSTLRKIKEWFKLVKPHKGYISGLFITSIISSCIPIVQAIPNAMVITNITNKNFDGAAIALLLSLACNVVFYVSSHFNYKFYYSNSRYCVINLNKKIYEKISLTSSQGLNQNSLEKTMMIASSNTETVCRFSDYLTYQSCYILRAFITIFIVCFYNILSGLIMLGVLILLYFWYVYLNKLVHKHTTELLANRETLCQKVTDYVEGRNTTDKLNLNKNNKEEYLKQVKKITNSYNRRGLVNVTRKYWTYAGLYVVATALTILLAILTNANNLDLTIYLIIAPYLINIIDQASSGYEILYNLEQAHIICLRINTILNMPNSDIVTFSNNTTDNLTSNLVFNNVSTSNQSESKKDGEINKISLILKPNTITLIQGGKNCGKRYLFNMLKRTTAPKTGTITMDGINIYDFDKDTYKHNFSHTHGSPIFYNASIIENLEYVSSKSKAIKLCKQLDIHKTILSLPNGYSTNLVKEKDSVGNYLLFMIGLARAVLSKSEWIAIYEEPLSLLEKERI